MPKFMLSHQAIDECFRVLAEPARRAILERRSEGPASISTLAAPSLSVIPNQLGAAPAAQAFGRRGVPREM